MSLSAYWLWIWAVKICNIQRENILKRPIPQISIPNKLMWSNNTSSKHSLNLSYSLGGVSHNCLVMVFSWFWNCEMSHMLISSRRLCHLFEVDELNSALCIIKKAKLYQSDEPENNASGPLLRQILTSFTAIFQITSEFLDKLILLTHEYHRIWSHCHFYDWDSLCTHFPCMAIHFS